ncbi:NIPSNAP family protein [Flavisolibacter nicotianae]|uniref:NIPSNAP family protein n=1 Tax=Flavisolibacter nicotianae TaxID=2364882 RepID=UPI000EB3182A|nr:NIPSNAP family protein [Flavisolibacter nicotianae]
MNHPFKTFAGSFLPLTSFRSVSVLLFACFLFSGFAAIGQKSKSAKTQRDYLEIRVYHATDASQLAAIDGYLQSSLLPALEKGGFKRNGVFTAIDNDTAADKRLYVFIPFSSLSQLEQVAAIADRTVGDSVKAASYTNAAYNKAPYTRFENIVVHAFEGMPQVKASGVKGDLSQRVYELRSYESATEALHQNKVKMFNSGEVELFQRLGFNAVFYGQVVAGCHMPNLMYMTSFETKASREEHWKAFGSDPVWKAMSGDPIYQHNVSHIDITFLRPVAYSKL